MTDIRSSHEEMRQLVRQLLGAMTEGKEVRAWLKQFGQLERSRFAIIKIGGGTLQTESKTICAAMAFLQKLGLAPVIVHGGGPQIDAALSRADIKTPRVDGLRVTSEQAMPVIASALHQAALGFVSDLNYAGVHASFCPPETVTARLLNAERYGLVGEPLTVDTDYISGIANKGMLPILTSVALTPDGQVVNINADTLVRHIALELQPQKIIFLTPTGGMLDENGELVSVVHLATEYEQLKDEEWLAGGMKLKLQQIKELLDGLPLSASAAITRPEQLVRELFTHSGSGTLVRRGEEIRVVTRKDALDRKRMTSLIERAFGRTLITPYWDDLPFAFAIVSDSTRAAAVVARHNGKLYLDKFAVLEEARGEGLGAAVWHKLCDKASNFFWRSRIGNPVNPFYFAHAEGAVRTAPWHVFWRGAVDWQNLQEHVNVLGALPESFES